MILRRSGAAWALAAGLAACAPSGRDGSPLRADEQAFVETYVRILVLDARRSEAPDSVGPLLDRLAATHDSAAVRAALRRLDAEPERWELVYGEIARRLRDLERQPTPQDAWRALESARDGISP